MKTLTLCLALLLSQTLFAQQQAYLKDIKQTGKLSKDAAELFKQDKANEAMQLIKPYWGVAEKEKEKVTNKILDYQEVIKSHYGNTIKILKTKHETVADIGIRETYLVQMEKSAVRLVFTYFKSPNGWFVHAFKWDDKFSEEFKEEK